jgi:hypothetical protein
MRVIKGNIAAIHSFPLQGIFRRSGGVSKKMLGDRLLERMISHFA